VDTQTAKIFAESGVRLRQFSPPTGGLVDLGVITASEEKGEAKADDVRELLNDDNFVRPLS
jgi:dCMP deaminase